MKLFYLFLFSLIFTFSPRAGAADAEGGQAPKAARLSLSEVTQAVLENNPSIKSSLKKWNAMKSRIPQAAAWEDPKVSATSRVARYVNIGPEAFTDQMFSVEQMIPLSGKNLARARAARAEALAAFEEARRQELDVVAKARGSYFRLANVYAQIELNRKNLVSLKQIAEVSRTKYQVGEQSAAYVLSAETEYSRLMETWRDLDQQRAAEESQLNVLMNRDAFAPVAQPEEIDVHTPPPSIEKLRELALAQRPEVRAAAAKVDQAKAYLQLARREWIPDPSVVVQAQRYNSSSQPVSEVDAGISFSLPWLNYNKYSAEIHEAEENFGAAQLDLQGARAEAVGALRDALEKVEAMHHHMELFHDKIVPQARQAFEASQLGYENDKVGFLDWITAQRNLRDLESLERQALGDYEVAIAELEAVIGSDLTTSSQPKNTKP